MPLFTVLRKEIHYSHVQVEASNPREALEKIIDGEGEEVQLEYSDTFEPSEWIVVDLDGNHISTAKFV